MLNSVSQNVKKANEIEAKNNFNVQYIDIKDIERNKKNFYEELGDRLWGEYGFKDAFNLTENWFAPSYLAIDQGPIIVMIENYRTGLIWKLFMSHPDVQKGLRRLGFTSPYLNKVD